MTQLTKSRPCTIPGIVQELTKVSLKRVVNILVKDPAGLGGGGSLLVELQL